MKSQSLTVKRTGIADYAALMKPRVMMLVVFTAVVGLLLAPANPEPLSAVLALCFIALGAGAAGALNMWYDRDIDRLMKRTALRPIPTGRVSPQNAITFGLSLTALSVTGLGLVANWIAAALLALTIAYYVFVYTIWLKRRTTQSVVIGGVAGALPPVVGWASVTGGVEAGAIILFAIIFLWTPPHSWALTIYQSTDFAKADLPDMQTADQARAARIQIFLYSALMFPVALLPAAVGIANSAYLALATVLGAIFIVAAWRLLRSGAGEIASRARALFEYSIFYLSFIFAALLLGQMTI